MTTTRQTLGFGYNEGLVDGLTCAWGARWIVNQDGLVDCVPGRSDAFGSEEGVAEVLAWLNGTLGEGYGDEAALSPFLRAVKVLRRLLADYTVRTREARPVILHQDREGAIVGNTNASAGYFYVAAYRYADLPEGHPTKGLERVIDTLKAMREERTP